MQFKTTTSETSSPSTTTTEDFLTEIFPERTPYVRFCETTETGGQTQEPRLRPTQSPTPEWADFASPVYFLSPTQEERMQALWENPRRTKGTRNIAIELQDECEAAGHVLYPVYAESDAVDDGVPLREMVEWLQEFVRGVLDVSHDECHLYYSGGRSVHLHAPQFVTHAQLGDLKAATESFCEESGADLDTCIYSRKRQFRLPGVTHASGRPKVRLDPEDPNGSVARCIRDNDVPQFETFAKQLTDLLDPYLAAGRTPFPRLPTTRTDAGMRAPDWPVPRTPEEQNEYDAYNRHEFSPYANSRVGGQSVVAFKVLGGVFERRATYGEFQHVPAYIYGGHGCTGLDYTKHKEHAPIQLSGPDAEKWDFEEGTRVVLIGGQSRCSRFLTISEEEATVLADDHLHYENGDRHRALTYLEQQGHDVGKGKVRTTSNEKSGGEDGGELVERSVAAALERKAEQDGIHSLSHLERRRIAFRRLRRNWRYAWEWFEEQFAEEFNPLITRQQFVNCIQAFPEDYAHVDVPEESK